MIDYFFNILRQYPAIAIFLTVGLGFLIGKIRIGSFTLGSVTSALLVGVLVGQINIPMSSLVKQIFFMMFLFSIGYSVGPEFFKSLRGSGARQALFAVCMSSMCCAVTLLISWIFHYSKGETIGLFSGSQTCSALLGVGSEALGRLNLTPETLKHEMNIIPTCYAVTYIFGTFGTVLLLGSFGPKLLGGLEKVKKETLELEKKLYSSDSHSDPSYMNALTSVSYRSYLINNEYFSCPKTVTEIERHLHDLGLVVYIDRIKVDGNVLIPHHNDLIGSGDEIVLCGRREYMVHATQYVGEEVSDTELLSYPLSRLTVRVVRKGFIGIRLSSLRRKVFMRGVVVRDCYRDGRPMDITDDVEFRRGDLVTIVGRPISANLAAARIGHVDRKSVSSDLMFVGLAIFIGGLFGALCFYIDSIPISFGTSGGSLISGLVFGWLRTKRPTYGYIPPSALWLMNNLGLNVFVAVVGIEAAPSFVSGIETVGPMLFIAGAVGTLIPLLFGLFIGHKLFKFNPAITLGCCAGTRTCTAALGAVQNTLGSTLPAMGYTVTYAVSNILLVIWGLVTVLIV